MSRQSEAVKKWRQNTKEKIVKALGGKCNICGYDRCINALALHHLNPEEKELNFGKVRANPKTWDKIKEEVKKCILVCHNCHSEIHTGLKYSTKQLEEKRILDEELLNYKKVFKKDMYNSCPICGKDKPITLITCSQKCAKKKAWKLDWSKVDLLKELESKSFVQVGDELGISDVSVRKRYKRILQDSLMVERSAVELQHIPERIYEKPPKSGKPKAFKVMVIPSQAEDNSSGVCRD